MRKENYTYQEYEFEIQTVSQENSVEGANLIVVLKYKSELLESYHVNHETVRDYKYQNQKDLENYLYEIVKTEIKSKFIEKVKTL